MGEATGEGAALVVIQAPGLKVLPREVMNSYHVEGLETPKRVQGSLFVKAKWADTQTCWIAEKDSKGGREPPRAKETNHVHCGWHKRSSSAKGRWGPEDQEWGPDVKSWTFYTIELWVSFLFDCNCALVILSWSKKVFNLFFLFYRSPELRDFELLKSLWSFIESMCILERLWIF